MEPNYASQKVMKAKVLRKPRARQSVLLDEVEIGDVANVAVNI